MKKSVAMNWVKALRSGKYKKGKLYLKKDNNFCCLGVMCDISGLGKWQSNVMNQETYLTSSGEQRSGVLPKDVELWAGLSSGKGEYRGKNGRTYSLTNWNDNGYQDFTDPNDKATPQTFEQIANFIEKNWKIL